MTYRPPMTQPPRGGLALPRPGKALTGAMVTLLAIWVMFAVGINWGGGGANIFELGVGDTDKILSGQVWRLFTAPLLHVPSGSGSVGHIVTALLGLYFLAPSLEKKWGGGWMLAFVYGSAIAGFLLHMLLQIAIPAPYNAALVQPWFGSLSAVHAVAIAWTLSFRGQRVLLMFVLPVSSTLLVIFVVGIAVLRLLAADSVPEGLVSAFGAMGFAWLAAGSEPSPLRKLWLKWRLRKLAAQKSGPSTRPPSANVEDDLEDDDEDEVGDEPPRGQWLH